MRCLWFLNLKLNDYFIRNVLNLNKKIVTINCRTNQHTFLFIFDSFFLLSILLFCYFFMPLKTDLLWIRSILHFNFEKIFNLLSDIILALKFQIYMPHNQIGCLKNSVKKTFILSGMKTQNWINSHILIFILKETWWLPPKVYIASLSSLLSELISSWFFFFDWFAL